MKTDLHFCATRVFVLIQVLCYLLCTFSWEMSDPSGNIKHELLHSVAELSKLLF